MLSRIQFDKVLFLDIETVPQIYQYVKVETKADKIYIRATNPKEVRTKSK